MPRALLSVFDKKGLVQFSKVLSDSGVEIISTGGTFQKLHQENIPHLLQVSDVTKFPEILDGRVKTLHPHIHGALLAKMDVLEHRKELEDHHIVPIQLVAVNLYPFEETISKPNTTLDEALENIDIGGVALIRASAKNFAHVVIVVDPEDYSWIGDRIKSGGFQSISLRERKALALKAFQHVCSYDAAISQYLGRVEIEDSNSNNTPSQPKPKSDSLVVRQYHHQFDLKYGCNPHQIPSAIYQIKGLGLPFRVLNGVPGYINFLDALNSWQLVKELRESLHLPAAASFKHVSPAGTAVAVPLTNEERDVYDVGDKELTPLALAYLRARNADPMCSYGDFAAVSDVVDEKTALLLKTEVSDGIIAPGFDEKAFEILKQKKNGAYIIIQANPDYIPPEMEYREVYGVVFSQKRNNTLITQEHITKDIVTKEKALTEEAIRDLLVATISVKYTQSNSVGYAIRGQMIGVGAGQQSRVDCAKLAAHKVRNWYMRFHPKIREMKFRPNTKKVDKTNVRIHFIENELTKADTDLFTNSQGPSPLTNDEKEEWMKTLGGVSLSSDAFFPFRDSIDVCAKYGVKFVAQPGGSIQDQNVVDACNEYGMIMCATGVRLFHH